MDHVKAKKSLGQNFLQDVNVVEGVLDIGNIGSGDPVFEIGPGTGALTGPLLSRGAKVKAIELDHDLAERLSETFRDSSDIELIEGNILDMDMDGFLLRTGLADHGYKVIANIPYYITAPIIRKLLSLSIRPERIVLMVQEEVADRLAAPPGKMSLISLMAQFYATVTKELDVPKSAFVPAPKVDSAVVKLVPKRVFSKEGDRNLFRIARAGFSARRKTLANNLSSSLHFPRKNIESMLSSLGLDIRVRAQELSVDDWLALSEVIEKFGMTYEK
ncbi:MAG: ribosomal RNA small subunit methyltransferase A [Candidatus Moranbacteria bacterium]|nr:ribosomal RNA small subunit methyltransferase A [Candidatus Moranbacteria bacterium]